MQMQPGIYTCTYVPTCTYMPLILIMLMRSFKGGSLILYMCTCTCLSSMFEFYPNGVQFLAFRCILKQHKLPAVFSIECFYGHIPYSLSGIDFLPEGLWGVHSAIYSKCQQKLSLPFIVNYHQVWSACEILHFRLQSYKSQLKLLVCNGIYYFYEWIFFLLINFV